jgi:hypothetical protein
LPLRMASTQQAHNKQNGLDIRRTLVWMSEPWQATRTTTARAGLVAVTRQRPCCSVTDTDAPITLRQAKSDTDTPAPARVTVPRRRTSSTDSTKTTGPPSLQNQHFTPTLPSSAVTSAPRPQRCSRERAGDREGQGIQLSWVRGTAEPAKVRASSKNNPIPCRLVQLDGMLCECSWNAGSQVFRGSGLSSGA